MNHVEQIFSYHDLQAMYNKRDAVFPFIYDNQTPLKEISQLQKDSLQAVKEQVQNESMLTNTDISNDLDLIKKLTIQMEAEPDSMSRYQEQIKNIVSELKKIKMDSMRKREKNIMDSKFRVKSIFGGQ